ncbi:MAG: Gfo/Idh/MocA family oxidoreductase [Rhodospirillales bacterium]|nr:Gfo/Idh/MocA family oxidoreductase [Rhodospirillales bacterium]MDP6645000.1 Gfo/Idh/MocA family oxidoreductase [Rhodospirillales bacterium]MDP6841973.1 Gfo/Idh/MocA family oxidoreductase [Rhodospirillales bacterium]
MLKIVIIGTGWWGKELAKAGKGLPEIIEILGCCSLSESECAFFQAHFGGKVYDELDEVLSDPDVDAVLLATPHSLHWRQVISAADAGKQVFCEKPLALTAETASQAIEACERNSVVLAVGHNRRFSEAAREMKSLIEQGACGQIIHIDANYSGNASLHYPPDYWRAQRAENPGGAIGPMGLHMVDTLTWISGPIRRLAAICKRQAASNDLDDTTMVMFELDGGITGTLSSLFAAPGSSHLRFYGTGAILEARDNFSELRMLPADPATPETLKKFSQDLTLRAELGAFAEATAGGADYPVRPAEALRNIAVMESIVKSSDAGGIWTDIEV